MQAINAVDLYLLGFLNRFAHRSPIFDQSISFLANQPLLKAGLLTSALWLAWFRPNPNQKLRRELVISTLAATVTSTINAGVEQYHGTLQAGIPWCRLGSSQAADTDGGMYISPSFVGIPSGNVPYPILAFAALLPWIFFQTRSLLPW